MGYMITTQAGVGLQSFEFHPKPATYHVRFDQETTAASMAVIGTMTTILDCDPTELDPLYDAVDADALDNCVRVRGTGTDVTLVSFAFEAHAITVSSSGAVAATPPPATRRTRVCA